MNLLALPLAFAFFQSPAPDLSTEDAIVKALYDVISGPAGQKRDWDRMRSLFLPQAHMTIVGKRPDGTAVMRTITLDDYVRVSGPVMEQRGFFEREISRRAEKFGHLVHIWSTYEGRTKAEDPQPLVRGVNSIQLVFDGKRWWVSSLAWQAEEPNLPLPDGYLKTGG